MIELVDTLVVAQFRKVSYLLRAINYRPIPNPIRNEIKSLITNLGVHQNLSSIPPKFIIYDKYLITIDDALNTICYVKNNLREIFKHMKILL